MRNYFIYSLFIATFSLFSLSIEAQTDPVVDKIIEIGKTDNQTMQHLDILSNRIGGRLIGSDNYETAVKWAKSEFEKWGMDAVLHESGVLPIGFNRGPWFGRMLGGDNSITALDFATPSYTVGTKGVQRGHVMIEPKTRREFERMKGKLKGAWVLVSGTSTGFPIDYSSDANQLRDSILAENEKIEIENDKIRRYNWENRNEEIGRAHV